MGNGVQRTGRWVPIVYYYLVTVIGLVIMLVGLIVGLQALVRVAFPQLSDRAVFMGGPYPPPDVISEGVIEKRPEAKLATEKAGSKEAVPPPEKDDQVMPEPEKTPVESGTEKPGPDQAELKRRAALKARFGERGDYAELAEVREQEFFRQARLHDLSDAIEGLIAAAVGAPVFFWHLRQARRKDQLWFGGPPPAPGESPS